MKRKIYRKSDLPILVAVLITMLFSISSARAQASGGAFTLERTVIAGGGSQMSQQPFTLNGTTGQAVAGAHSTGGNFTLSAGFWTPENFAPTASGVTVGGRVRTAEGRGIRSVLVTITFPSGEQRTAVSGTSGYYHFADVPAGATYAFRVTAKRYTFSQPSQIRMVTDEAQDIDFVADAPALPPGEISPQ